MWKPNLALAGQIIGVLRMEDGAVNPCFQDLNARVRQVIECKFVTGWVWFESDSSRD